MRTCNRLEAGGSKLEAWLTAAVFLSFEPQASCLKLVSALADGLMLVFQHAVREKDGPADWTRGPSSNIINAVLVKSRQ
jgi:hypothetical protein